MNAYSETTAMEAQQTIARQRGRHMSDYTVDSCPFCGEEFDAPIVAKYYGEEDCEFFCQRDEDLFDAQS